MKKSYLLIIYFILAAIFLVFYFSLDNKKIYNTENIIGKKIEIVELTLFTNNIFNTKEISNFEYTLINFWASWCGPCRKEHKNLVRLSKLTNLKIIGINFKDDENNAKKFLKEMGNPFSILAKDTSGKKSIEFGIYGIPETILINRDLIVLKKYVGPLNRKDVNEIKKLVSK
tara:strand:- start:97 stop:612 length:516 start_codon:yes stop_codon:yes gene_type:complete